MGTKDEILDDDECNQCRVALSAYEWFGMVSIGHLRGFDNCFEIVGDGMFTVVGFEIF